MGRFEMALREELSFLEMVIECQPYIQIQHKYEKTMVAHPQQRTATKGQIKLQVFAHHQSTM